MPPSRSSVLPLGLIAARAIGLDRLLGPKNPREPSRKSRRFGDLVLAMVAAGGHRPASKLATAKALDPATASSSLGVELALGEIDEDELYAALDWLHERQGAIEAGLARRHLKGGTLVLYDVSSSYVEGRCCPLAKRGYNRDGKKGKAQIVYGLLCAADGCPIAIEVFEGRSRRPKTVADQVAKLKLGHPQIPLRWLMSKAALHGLTFRAEEITIDDTVNAQDFTTPSSLRT